MDAAEDDVIGVRPAARRARVEGIAGQVGVLIDVGALVVMAESTARLPSRRERLECAWHSASERSPGAKSKHEAKPGERVNGRAVVGRRLPARLNRLVLGLYPR